MSEHDDTLGRFLRLRREKLDPAAFGLPLSRRRTSGLRREEVAQRANISATWYTWLEQGRGGAPSADALNRIARALLLSDAEREYLFLLALGRQPDVRFDAHAHVPPRLQRLLDALEYSPAYITTSTWDLVAWNRAAATVLLDYETVPPEHRNLLWLYFCHPLIRSKQPDWENVGRFVVAAFRADVTRAGAARAIQPLVEELTAANPEFAAMWRDNDVRDHYGEVTKQVQHPRAGLLTLDYSSFAVDGRPDLNLVVYTPTTPGDASRIRTLMTSEPLQER